MSEDVGTPVPEYPGEDPESAEGGPHTDGYGLSDTPDAGYGLDEPAGPPEQGQQPEPDTPDDAGAVGHA